MNQMRLDKYLCEMGCGSRTEVKHLIKKGKVTVNGQAAKHPEAKVMPGTDNVCLAGEAVVFVDNIYMMFNKPAGCVCATKDDTQRTVLDYIDGADCTKKNALFPVGRLDKDTEGLLILTNDGALAHQLLSPKKHVEKQYFVRLKNRLKEEDKGRFLTGIDIGDEKPTKPAGLEILETGKEAYVTLTEGRFHQIKRMFEACGNEVLYLKRVRMGGLWLDEGLLTGQYRQLLKQELARLKQPQGNEEK